MEWLDLEWLDIENKKPYPGQMVLIKINTWFCFKQKEIFLTAFYEDENFYPFHFDTENSEIKSYLIKNISKWGLIGS